MQFLLRSFFLQVMNTRAIVYTLTGIIGYFLFWSLVHPEFLSFQEQNQCLLLTWDYFKTYAVLMGGPADYLAEFITQFFFYPVLGAFLFALILGGIQYLIWYVSPSTPYSFPLSFVFPLLLLSLHGNQDVMLTYSLSLLMVLLLFALSKHAKWYITVMTQIILCYLTGPLALLYAGMTCVTRWKTGMCMAATAVMALIIGHFLLNDSYPIYTTWKGCFYFRLTLKETDIPNLMWLIPGLMVISLLASRKLAELANSFSGRYLYTFEVISILLTGTLGGYFAASSYDENTSTVLEQIYLIRGGKWDPLLTKADKYCQSEIPVMKSEVSCTAVNLALAMKNKMTEHYNDYPQCGPNGLISLSYHDNISGIASMEALFRLGLVRQAERYAFEMQESISNHKKSAHLTKRLAECAIIEGNYKIAQKYLCALKQTMFYSDWAKNALLYLDNEELVAHHPIWGKIKSFQLAKDTDSFFLKSHIPYYLQQLYLRNPENELAKSYLVMYLNYLNYGNRAVAGSNR